MYQFLPVKIADSNPRIKLLVRQQQAINSNSQKMSLATLFRKYVLATEQATATRDVLRAVVLYLLVDSTELE